MLKEFLAFASQKECLAVMALTVSTLAFVVRHSRGKFSMYVSVERVEDENEEQ